MAYNFYDARNFEPDSKQSEFNAAALKMKRLDKMIDENNEIRHHLDAFNLEKNDWNFNIFWNNCVGLYGEVESKLSTKEKDETRVVYLKDAISLYLKRNPLVVLKRNKSSKKTKPAVSQSSLEVIMPYLEEFELVVKRLIDAHGMDTKYYDEDEDDL